MLVNFNIERLDSLLSDFYKLTGMTISVWDSQLRQLSYFPKDMTDFCRLIKNTELGNKRCFECDKTLCLKTLTERLPQSHRCHAGLIDTAIPITFKETVLGFLMFGQAASATADNPPPDWKRLGEELGIDECALQKSYLGLQQHQPELIQAAANILKLATRYLWLSDMIKVDQNDLAERLREFVWENTAENITVELLCQTFYLSKNKLYALIKEKFRQTIGSFVRSVRIEKAKKLLEESDLPVYEIASAVGFSEYNYFIKLFKADVGVSPSLYRKKFPL